MPFCIVKVRIQTLHASAVDGHNGCNEGVGSSGNCHPPFLVLLHRVAHEREVRRFKTSTPASCKWPSRQDCADSHQLSLLKLDLLGGGFEAPPLIARPTHASWEQIAAQHARTEQQLTLVVRRRIMLPAGPAPFPFLVPYCDSRWPAPTTRFTSSPFSSEFAQ